MSATVQLEPTVQLHDAPKLLVEWSPRWREFTSSLRPALGRSEARLAGEAPFGLIPFRIAIPTYALEAFLVFAVIALQVKIEQLRPHVVPRVSGHEVIYYSGDELPRTEDLGGSEAGRTGRSGGDEAQHRTQTIKIVRGGSLVPKVVDAPNLKLPSSRDAVANLLAIRPDPGPPPSEGLRSARSSITLPTSLVAPPPNAIRDYTRNGIQLESVVAPAPALTRDQLTAPNFSASVIPPAPKITSDHTLGAPALAPNVIAPAPGVSRDRALSAPSLNPSVVAPAPTISRDAARSAPALTGNVIPPAPGSVTHEISSAPVQMTSAVVPPPVSAPERTATGNAKLSLPAPSVVAPPPSSDVSQDMRRLASGGVSDPSQAVVPPPPTQPASSGLMSSLIGKIFGPTQVAPPPPSVNATGPSRNAGTPLSASVVPPPPSVAANQSGGNPRGARNGMSSSSSLGSNVVAPPPVAGVSGGAGTRSQATSAAPTLGLPSVVPPPPALSGPGGGTGNSGGGAGTPGGTLLANNVVPPPPSVGGGANSTGSGLGRNGSGFGSAMNVGAPSAPASNGGSGNNAGAVISSQPGSKVGLPATGGTGALAMSPSGGDKSGLSGSGGGTGIGRDNGPGSGMTGTATGAGKAGPGRGSDPNARGGISSTTGPGGAGTGASGNPAVPGVSISGGSTVVTLPSFGSDLSANDPNSAGRSSVKHGQALGVTVVATATSGGAFEPYKKLFHGEVRTIYPDTSLGTVVMEFSEVAAHSNAGTLSSPEAIRTDLPDGLTRARLVVQCTLDASGNLRNIRVLEPGPAAMTAKVIAALPNWKFQPAMRGETPVEVTAILGFGIDTNDRF